MASIATLGILVNLGTNTKVVVKPTTPGSAFSFPARVFYLGGSEGVGVTVQADSVTFTSLNEQLIRVFVTYQTPNPSSIFLVTYDPSTLPADSNPAIFLWNFALGADPNDANSTLWDGTAEKVVDLAGNPA